MRTLLITVLTTVPFALLAQKKVEPTWPAISLDPKTNLISYSDVPNVPGASSAELYDRALAWAKGFYKNAAEKIRKQDREAGTLEIFARIPIYAYDKKGIRTASRQGLVQYTLAIRFRDGRYKYAITKFNLKGLSYQPLENWLDRNDPNARNHAFYLTDLDAEIKRLIASMNAAIATPPEEDADDW